MAEIPDINESLAGLAKEFRDGASAAVTENRPLVIDRPGILVDFCEHVLSVLNRTKSSACEITKDQIIKALLAPTSTPTKEKLEEYIAYYHERGSGVGYADFLYKCLCSLEDMLAQNGIE